MRIGTLSSLPLLKPMPTVPIGDEGAELFYADSGVPNGSTDYVTIVLVHGVVFHGGTPVRSSRNPIEL